MNKVKKTVYFVRHGQSEENALPVFQSTTSPLSELGIKQAQFIAERVSKLTFDALIASPYERAKQTAEAIAKATGKDPEFNDVFVERIKPTSIDGKPFSDNKAKSIWMAWEESLSTPNSRVEDGENFDDIIARADRAISFLYERDEEVLVVVSHGYFIRTLIARVVLGTSLNAESFRAFQNTASMENTGLSAIVLDEDWEGKEAWRMWIYNDHAHLG